MKCFHNSLTLNIFGELGCYLFFCDIVRTLLGLGGVSKRCALTALFPPIEKLKENSVQMSFVLPSATLRNVS